MDNETERFKIIKMLFSILGKGKDEERQEMYVDATTDMPLDQLKTSVMRIVKTHSVKDYFPLPGDILAPMNSALEDAKNQKWLEFKSRFRRTYNSTLLGGVVDDDVYTIKKRIGESKLYNASEKDFEWIMKDVKKEWESIQEFPQHILSNPMKKSDLLSNCNVMGFLN